jgi:enoyl-CoA hydratase/carnithine racemase
MPGLKVGLFCTTPGVELIRALPSTKKALELLLLSEAISSEDAEKLGLINHIFEEGKIDQLTLEFAAKIA